MVVGITLQRLDKIAGVLTHLDGVITSQKRHEIFGDCPFALQKTNIALLVCCPSRKIDAAGKSETVHIEVLNVSYIVG